MTAAEHEAARRALLDQCDANEAEAAALLGRLDAMDVRERSLVRRADAYDARLAPHRAALARGAPVGVLERQGHLPDGTEAELARIRLAASAAGAARERWNAEYARWSAARDRLTASAERWASADRARDVARAAADPFTARQLLRQPDGYLAARQYIATGRWSRAGHRRWMDALSRAAAKHTTHGTRLSASEADVDAVAARLTAGTGR